MHININVSQQTLHVFEGDLRLKEYVISTGANGVGELNGSECTPRGEHIIRAKIGVGAEPNSVFVARRFTGEIYNHALKAKFPGRDWILTRILWLSGTEPRKNRLGQRDTMRRYIYIHGTPDDVELGKPGSKGCIRMNNQDIIELFNSVEIGVPVDIRVE